MGSKLSRSFCDYPAVSMVKLGLLPMKLTFQLQVVYQSLLLRLCNLHLLGWTSSRCAWAIVHSVGFALPRVVG